MKENYLTPEVEYLSLDNEGILCSSDPMKLPGASFGEEIEW